MYIYISDTEIELTMSEIEMNRNNDNLLLYAIPYTISALHDFLSFVVLSSICPWIGKSEKDSFIHTR